MPLYEYQCDVCGRRFEKIQKYSDPPIETCPTCGGIVHKLVSSPAFQFKGTGWYVTDYSRKDKGGSGDSDKGASASGESTGKNEKSDKSESKSDSKTSEAGKSGESGTSKDGAPAGKDSSSSSSTGTSAAPPKSTPKS
jgi:putative FmdB family regulatory protein